MTASVNEMTGSQPTMIGARLRGTVMTWLAAVMVTTSLLALAAFLLFLLWLGVGWLQAGGASEGLPESTGFLINLKRLLLGPTGIQGGAAMLPAIVGTTVLIFLMTVIVAPLGVVVAVYLREYARDSWYTELVRIGVQNLAGVPSIIYGVFGLGFFVYGVGGQIDLLFFSEQLPTPTFGTPGLLWSALTLAMLTLPVVIVSTEEGLSRLPQSLREGSYALGATRSETVLRILIPAAAPSIFTGLILAIARAAGEVAPLMLVGVVKYAPTLPVSLSAPFIHLEQKFMHMGFYVYDIATQANLPDGRLGFICAASTLLVVVVMSLNLTAIALRSRLRERYREVQGV